ncbi:hypothetical protein AVEN_171823-1 [Araneus ventricosus]|uniref:Uncharacterized protein n=1 Tax=Araneus ventricosus TaxID=182803 RepID=A0A4Y2LNN3_ARAVE|nr:hypothetical protein AVEN_171823-1 [Araneus ventricosus]
MNSKTESYSAAANNSVMNTVLDKIFNLEKQISELNVHRQSRSKYRHSGFNRSNSLSHSRKKYNSNGSYGYYYFKVGDKCYPNKCKAHVAGRHRKTPISSRFHGRFCCR